MKSFNYTLLASLLVFTLVSCAQDNAEESGATPAAAGPNTSTPGAAPSSAAKTGAPPAPPKPAAARTFEVPSGTEITIILTDALSSGKNQAGDQFQASLAAPILVNGQTIIDRGAKVQGRVVDAESSGRVKGLANMRLILTSIVDGAKTYPIVTKPFYAEAEATKARDAGIIGGAAGVGAAIGAIAGGKKGAATGAAIGGGAGTGTVLATKGKEVEFPSETKLTFTLDQAAQLPAIKNIS
ncbi:MAG: hypothetical protein HY646_17100 [Acidobacteria bacterium]|nr:hypothetical protein [Acidobacteriota bacterium]